MNLLNSIADFLGRLLNWWFTVQPWEQAIHVRRGKVAKVKGPGFYWQIPFVDKVFIQTTRMRMMDVPMQTMSSKDGSAITVKSVIGYSIIDVLKVYQTLYHPEVTLGSMVQSGVGQFIRENLTSAITPAGIEEYVKIDGDQYGIGNVTVKITTFAIVKVFRLMQDNSTMYDGLNMNSQQPQPR